MLHKFLCNIRTPCWGHRTIFDIVQRPDPDAESQRSLFFIQGGEQRLHRDTASLEDFYPCWLFK